MDGSRGWCAYAKNQVQQGAILIEHRETQDMSATSAGLFPPRQAVTIAMPYQLRIGVVMRQITNHLHVGVSPLPSCHAPDD